MTKDQKIGGALIGGLALMVAVEAGFIYFAWKEAQKNNKSIGGKIAYTATGALAATGTLYLLKKILDPKKK